MPNGLERTFGTLLGPGIDFGDLYFQHARRESWTVEDGIVKDGAHSIEQGVGVRAISGEKTGFAYSDEIDGVALITAAKSARAIARDGAAHNARALVPGNGRALYRAGRSDRRASATRTRSKPCASSTSCCVPPTRACSR